MRTAIADMVQANNLKVYTAWHIVCKRLDTREIGVYNITGALVYQGIARDDRAEVPLPGRGMYIVTAGKVAVKVNN